MDQDLEIRLKSLEDKIEHIWHAVELTRKMYLWTAIISIALFIIPLIGLMFAIPAFLKSVDINQILQ